MFIFYFQLDLLINARPRGLARGDSGRFCALRLGLGAACLPPRYLLFFHERSGSPIDLCLPQTRGFSL